MAAFNLTPRQLEILVAYVKESKAAVDWDKVAQASNCKTGKYARDQFSQIRNRLLSAAQTSNGGTEGGNDDAAQGDGNTTNPTNNKKAKSSPTKRKKDGDDNETPSKKGKKATTKSKGKKAGPGDGSDAEVKEEPNEAGSLMDDLEETEFA